MRSALAIAITLLLGCSSSHGGASTCAERDAAPAETPRPGCFPQAPGQICQVPGSCKPLCADSQYEMVCHADVVAGGSTPAPAPALGCQVIAIPNPAGTVLYCCPCEH
jgi:hypothetical protein